MAVQRRRVAWTLLLACGAALQSCQSPSADAPVTAPPTVPAYGRAAAGAGPTVSAANPASARQGTVTLDVQISGSGFDEGSQASWQLNGVTYPKVAVNKTQFINSTSLIANITVAQDAAAVTYDIAVTTSTGKKGIGAELFTVTYAVAIPGMTAGQAINDAGQIVGYNGTAIVLSDPSLGIVPVASGGFVNDIDRNGRTVVGQDVDGDPVIWSPSGVGGTWMAVKLPSLGAGGTARGIASDAAGDAVLISGATVPPGAPRKPTVWARTATGWQPTYLAIPHGTPSAWGQAINSRGQVAGMDGTGCCLAIYWDSLGAATALGKLGSARNAAAWSINGDGTIIVGGSGTSAVMWRRTLIDGSYGPWSGAIALENTASFCGKNGSSLASDVNAAGTVVVGVSCGIATAWRLSGGVVSSRVVLQGLGPPNQSSAVGINDLAAPQAVGQAKASTGALFRGF